MKTNAVVTGLGCITPLGNTIKSTWSSLLSGKSAIRPIQNIDIDLLDIKHAAEIVDYDPLDYFEHKQLQLLDRFTQFTLIAAEEAILDSGITWKHDQQCSRTAIILGTGAGARQTNDEALQRFYDEKKRILPTSIPKGLFNAPASHISMRYGITGPAMMITTACASSNHAIAVAADMINHDQADIVITGGCEACITLPFFKGWEALRIMDPVTCRPFSKDRQGFCLGEGAGIIVLESEEHAKKREAEIYASVPGHALSSDANDLIAMSVEGATTTMRKALDMAGLTPEDIDYISAHGTGTQMNDLTETQAIHQVFGEYANKLSVSSTKSMHGHAIGASSAFEFIATVMAIRNGVIPPTANYDTPDPECDLDYVPNKAKQKPIRAAISNAFAFGGLNAVVAITKYPF